MSGFPHSEISGSKIVCISPKLIAAYHVFHRLPVPRHSPCALCSLTVRNPLLRRPGSLPFLALRITLFSSWILHLPTRFLCKNCSFYLKSCFAVFIQFSRYVLYSSPTLSGRIAISWPQFRVSPSLRPHWWAQMESNHRPRAYQARALTA